MKSDDPIGDRLRESLSGSVRDSLRRKRRVNPALKTSMDVKPSSVKESLIKLGSSPMRTSDATGDVVRIPAEVRVIGWTHPKWPERKRTGDKATRKKRRKKAKSSRRRNR